MNTLTEPEDINELSMTGQKLMFMIPKCEINFKRKKKKVKLLLTVLFNVEESTHLKRSWT